MDTGLIRYDAMIHAIAECHQVDEIKDLRDKARALELYAQQAKNTDAERRAAEIRIRAERKTGELLKEKPTAQGKRTDIVASGDEVVDDRITRADLGISRDQASKWQQLADIPEQEFNEYLASESKPTTIGALQKKVTHGTQGTGDNEWYTPAEYIEAARKVLYVIDIDPASSAIANETVGAVKYFTIDDDGLEQPWHGRVWLNPPYSRDLLFRFVDKLVEEIEAGRCTSAICLTHAYTDTRWFHKLAKAADLMCLTLGRINFIDASGKRAQPTQGQTFFYFGKYPDLFRTVFSEIGHVC